MKHTCTICGHVGRWTKQWSWFGSILDLDAGVIVKICNTERCKATAEKIGPTYIIDRLRIQRGLKPRKKKKGETA